jgi:tetrapyrrole methylase family protein/MazG family protein
MHGDKFPELVALVERLRGPNGCPWDHEQSLETLKPMMLEEAYEVLEALDSGDRKEFCAELGDLLFQVVFLSHLAGEEGSFGIDDVIQAIQTKMIRRHPHVFGDWQAANAGEVLVKWERIKQTEREEKKEETGEPKQPASILEHVPQMPALLRAHKISSKAARVGFDWSNINDIFLKLHEEIDELKEALKSNQEQPAAPEVEQEVGDLLFVVVNIARFLKIDPETALRKTNQKFIQRFQYIEQQLRQAGKDVHESSLEEMERLWQEAKKTI